MPLERCPSCHAELNSRHDVGHCDDPPQPGDVDICFYCARVHVIGTDGKLRKPTDEEALEFLRTPAIMGMVSAVKRHGARDPGRRRAKGRQP